MELREDLWDHSLFLQTGNMGHRGVSVLGKVLLCFNPRFSLILCSLEGDRVRIRKGIKFWIERFTNWQGNLGFWGLGFTFALMSLAWLLPTPWPPFPACWSAAGPFLDPMLLPLTEVYFLYIQSGPRVTELGRLYNLQASVPGENTGSLV